MKEENQSVEQALESLQTELGSAVAADSKKKSKFSFITILATVAIAFFAIVLAGAVATQTKEKPADFEFLASNSPWTAILSYPQEDIEKPVPENWQWPDQVLTARFDKNGRIALTSSPVNQEDEQRNTMMYACRKTKIIEDHYFGKQCEKYNIIDENGKTIGNAWLETESEIVGEGEPCLFICFKNEDRGSLLITESGSTFKKTMSQDEE